MAVVKGKKLKDKDRGTGPEIIAKLSPAAQRVWTALARRCRGQAYPTIQLNQRQLARELGIAEATVRRALRAFIHCNLARLLRHGRAKRHPVYHLKWDFSRYASGDVSLRYRDNKYKHPLRDDPKGPDPPQGLSSDWKHRVMKFFREKIEQTPYQPWEKRLLTSIIGRVIWAGDFTREKALWLWERFPKKIKIPLRATTARRIASWFRWLINRILALMPRPPSPEERELLKRRPRACDFRSLTEWLRAMRLWLKEVDRVKGERHEMRRAPPGGLDPEPTWVGS